MRARRREMHLPTPTRPISTCFFLHDIHPFGSRLANKTHNTHTHTSCLPSFPPYSTSRRRTLPSCLPLAFTSAQSNSRLPWSLTASRGGLTVSVGSRAKARGECVEGQEVLLLGVRASRLVVWLVSRRQGDDDLLGALSVGAVHVSFTLLPVELYKASSEQGAAFLRIASYAQSALPSVVSRTRRGALGGRLVALLSLSHCASC